MDAQLQQPDFEFELDPELEAVIDRVSDRLARRFAWELRLQRWTDATLAVAAAMFVAVILPELYVLSSLTREASIAMSTISKTLS